MTKGKPKKSGRELEKLNVLSSLLRQLVSTACGVVIPRVMIGAFGSVVYGATVSIAQFVSYIALFEGGIGRVARGALYKSLAMQDRKRISSVYHQIERFFRKIGILFLLYALLIAVFYHDIAHIAVFDRKYTFGLVCVISLSTFANYMGGITNMTLLHANQKQYLTNAVIMITNVINVAAIVVLVWMNTDVLTVKLVSSLIFIIRPVMYAYYVRRDYQLDKVEDETDALDQKWTGLGQHIAYFLHTNTDIVLLTLFADLKYVAVYSVYHLVIKSIWNIASSFSGGMESAFGSVIARKEKKEFEAMFGRYKTMLTWVSLVMFGTASILLMPFIRLYTGGLTDADYIQPLFGLILLLAEGMNCIALPCCTLPISANCLKQTRWGSYMEAILNIVVSGVLIRWNPLLGVAIGTLAATAFKCIYYIVYTGRHFLPRQVSVLMRQFVLTVLALLLFGQIGSSLIAGAVIENYFIWCVWGVITVAGTGAAAFVFCRVVFPQMAGVDLKAVLNKIVCRGRTQGTAQRK